jgi:hypothetical protein
VSAESGGGGAQCRGGAEVEGARDGEGEAKRAASAYERPPRAGEECALARVCTRARARESERRTCPPSAQGVAWRCGSGSRCSSCVAVLESQR